MADYTDTKVSQLVINNLTQEKFEELKAAGELQDDQIYCTPDSGNGFDLFDSKWADHILNDPSWLRADNFSWHSGDVYKSAYEHLVNEYNADTTLGGQSETINGTTVYFRLAADGHKIVPANEEAGVQAVFESTGVAWYYIIDQTNKQFKLPRTRFGFTGLRDSVGNYVAEGLPNITGNFNAYSYGSGGGSRAVTSAISTSNTLAGGSQSSYNFNSFSIDASRSSSIYGASNTVQPRATQMYLYFYVGDWIKDKEIIDVGAITEELNNKADADLNNTQAFKKTGGELLGNILKDGVLARSPSETELMIKAGSNATNEDGALFVVYGKNGVSAGHFLARACSADGTMYDLRGAPSGSLQWGGKHVLREQAGSFGVKGYIKLSTGLIIQWGITDGAAVSHTITFPTSFGTGYSICFAPYWAGNGPFYAPGLTEKYNSYCVVKTSGNAEAARIGWIAVGY